MLDKTQPPSWFQNPPNLGQRRIGFGIEHKVQVITIVSKTESAKGRWSAEARSSDAGMNVSTARLLAKPDNSATSPKPAFTVNVGAR